MPEHLILVDRSNRSVGSAAKLAAHESGLLHRAFSIFLVDEQGRLLLQRRNPAKYHSGGLWANSCCGHPRPGERTITAARRRLREELGADAPLRFGFHAHYEAAVPHGLRENEIAYVYFGRTPASLAPNPGEVSEVAWSSIEAVRTEMRDHPERFAIWFRHYFERHIDEIARGVKKTLKPKASGRKQPRPLKSRARRG